MWVWVVLKFDRARKAGVIFELAAADRPSRKMNKAIPLRGMFKRREGGRGWAPATSTPPPIQAAGNLNVTLKVLRFSSGVSPPSTPGVSAGAWVHVCVYVFGLTTVVEAPLSARSETRPLSTTC